MHLEHVLRSFADLCDAPLAWAVVGLLMLKTGGSLYHYTHCPLVRGRIRDIDAAAAHALVQRPVLHSPRFLVLTLAGLALSIGGLYGLSTVEFGAVALSALVIGVFLLVVEPSQLSIDENELRVVAAGGAAAPDEARSLAVERLRWSHRERIGLEVALTVLVLALVLLY